MRLFAYVPGRPGYVIAEIAISDITATVVLALREAAAGGSGARLLTRREMLASWTSRSALLAWEMKDDQRMERDLASPKKTRHGPSEPIEVGRRRLSSV